MLTSIQSRRETLAQALQHCRAATLQLFTNIDAETFCCQAHPDFSPAGWHLGHIAYTEELWLLQKCAQLPPLFPEYRRLFVADALPKEERVNLPSIAEIYGYLEAVRTKVLDYLESAPLEEQERLWYFILQHESQHSETISFILLLQQKSQQTRLSSYSPSPSPHSQMIEIPAGEFELGSSRLEAMDNERPGHRCYLDTYWIDRYPVTCGQYQEFMEAGGYQNQHWWSEAGWEWLQKNPVNQPLYWSNYPDFKHHPVCGVSWYEAEAYCHFIGKRLPTEAEWEKAASWEPVAGVKRIYPWGDEISNSNCNHTSVTKIENFSIQNSLSQSSNQTTPIEAYEAGVSPYGCYDMLGNVWEWTASWFNAYQGFEHYPYPGYSHVYFDSQHRVLKGGSWATRPWALRASFRNWYHPYVRQILAGFRCAKS